MAAKQVHSVRLTPEVAAWAKEHGGLAAVIEWAMGLSPSAAVPRQQRAAELVTREAKARKARAVGKAEANIRCAHPATRRIGDGCGICGTTGLR
jgi:hypothetical protein